MIGHLHLALKFAGELDNYGKIVAIMRHCLNGFDIFKAFIDVLDAKLWSVSKTLEKPELKESNYYIRHPENLSVKIN
jgi:hypothetical protein